MYAKLGDERMSEVAAKSVSEGKDHANEGWLMTPGVLRRICTDVGDTLF